MLILRHRVITFLVTILVTTIVHANVIPSSVIKENRTLVVLDSLAYISTVNESNDRKDLADRLLKESVKYKNDFYKTNAYFLIVKYYYSINPDSMRYYIKISEPLFIKQKRWEDLFRMRGWNLYSLVNEGKTDEIIPNVNKMKAEARKVGYPEGEEIAEQGLAFAYFKENLTAEGLKLYEDVLAKMEARNAPIVKRFNIIRQLLNNDDAGLDLHKRCLEKLNRYIKYCEKNHILNLGNEMSLDYMKFVSYRTQAFDAALQNDFNTAYKALLKIEELHSEEYESDISLTYVWIKYYEHIKQYDKALALCKKVTQTTQMKQKAKNYLNFILMEANILKESSKYQEACSLYSEYITKNDSITSAKYYGDLAKLRNQHDIDNLALQNKKMELKATKDHSRMIMMEGGILFLVLICCAFGYISYTRNKHSIQLRKAKEKAEESDRLKSAFLANMNHEIRTPLNAIVGFSQVLIDEDNRENRAQYAKIIQSNNELLQQLIYDVLDLSKIESNTMQFTYKNIDLKQLMDNIFSAENLRMPEEVHLLLEDDENLTFYADPNRLTQILTNLLNNAIKHTQQGFIRFGYKKEMDKITFFVEDTGEGIPADKLDTIFARFVQLKDMDKGVGLGLAICKGLVSQMNGTISVRSTFGKGSTFTVYLPFRKEQ